MKKALHGIMALVAITYGTVGMAQCPAGSSEVTVFSTDFESNDGGFVQSGGGDWEYGTIPVTFSAAGCESLFANTVGAHSGTKGWGTILDGCYNNLGAFSSIAFTVDLSDPAYTSARLGFAQWFNVFVSFDYTRITANGTQVYLNNSTQDSNGWMLTDVDLTPFIGLSAVSISFDFWASTVVNRTGWYLDDVGVYACIGGTQAIAEGGAAAFQAWPVPAREVLHVEPGRIVTGWVLYDATGRVLAQGERGNADVFSIDVASFHGLGVLELNTADGLLRQRVVME